jgi:hypothetical protein
MTPAKKIYTCTICGKIGFWSESWSYYGSFAILDACPEELVYCCSESCQKIATKKINSGKWRLPIIGKNGVIKTERKGYPKLPRNLG